MRSSKIHERQVIRVAHKFCSVSDLDGYKVKDLISRLQEAIDRYGEDVELSYDYRFGDDIGAGSYEFVVSRPETREEYEVRIKKEGELKRKQEVHEYEEYLRLKKKFEESGS